MDVLPTVMDIVGVDISKQRKFDGKSIKNHLLNQADLPDRRVFFGYEPKLGTAMRDGHWKMQTKGNVVELYDLSKDIKETTNIADKYPKRTKEMKAAIAKWKLEVTHETAPYIMSSTSKYIHTQGLALSPSIKVFRRNLPDLYVTVRDFLAVVLQADVTFARQVFVGYLELIP